MSRKWERMVEKNRKEVNAKRKKSGAATIGTPKREQREVFKGRSWGFPVLLILIGTLNIPLAMHAENSKNSSMSYWTLVLYVALAVFMYFIRRPMLQIGKDTLVSRRFTGDKLVHASEIARIDLMKGAVMIETKAKKRWMYTKLTHMFPIPEVTDKLRTFAERNGVPLADATKPKN
ncbi:DUF986 family protein [Gorillibacterium massiliense]|uniref:DUF986 family protein n=1 Tax=Gorillibacterium massiliense TaxID=1280390 RepID=UPI0004B9DEDE|nr:DUF986 family protein [Gorillibacterium massiliense]